MSQEFNYTNCVIFARNGDRDAQNLLYKKSVLRFKKEIMKYFSDVYSVDRILQSSYVRIFTNLNRLTEPNQFIPWGLSICRDQCFAEVISRAEMNSSFGTIPNQHMDSPAAAASVATPLSALPPASELDIPDPASLSITPEESASNLNSLLSDLSPDERASVILWAENYPIHEIAQKLHQPEQNIVNKLESASAKMSGPAQASGPSQAGGMSAYAPMAYLCSLLGAFELFFQPELPSLESMASFVHIAKGFSTRPGTVPSAGRGPASADTPFRGPNGAQPQTPPRADHFHSQPRPQSMDTSSPQADSLRSDRSAVDRSPESQSGRKPHKDSGHNKKMKKGRTAAREGKKAGKRAAKIFSSKAAKIALVGALTASIATGATLGYIIGRQGDQSTNNSQVAVAEATTEAAESRTSAPQEAASTASTEHSGPMTPEELAKNLDPGLLESVIPSLGEYDSCEEMRSEALFYYILDQTQREDKMAGVYIDGKYQLTDGENAYDYFLDGHAMDRILYLFSKDGDIESLKASMPNFYDGENYVYHGLGDAGENMPYPKEVKFGDYQIEEDRLLIPYSFKSYNDWDGKFEYGRDGILTLIPREGQDGYYIDKNKITDTSYRD